MSARGTSLWQLAGLYMMPTIHTFNFRRTVDTVFIPLVGGGEVAVRDGATVCFQAEHGALYIVDGGAQFVPDTVSGPASGLQFLGRRRGTKLEAILILARDESGSVDGCYATKFVCDQCGVLVRAAGHAQRCQQSSGVADVTERYRNIAWLGDAVMDVDVRTAILVQSGGRGALPPVSTYTRSAAQAEYLDRCGDRSGVEFRPLGPSPAQRATAFEVNYFTSRTFRSTYLKRTFPDVPLFHFSYFYPDLWREAVLESSSSVVSTWNGVATAVMAMGGAGASTPSLRSSSSSSSSSRGGAPGAAASARASPPGSPGGVGDRGSDGV